MKKTNAITAAIAIAALASACAPSVSIDEARRVTLAPELAERALVGVARDAEPGVLRVLSVDEGLARVDHEGALLDENRYGSNGLPKDAYKALSVDTDGTVYLLADVEGFRFDARALAFEQHFCVLPGDDLVVDPVPGDPGAVPYQVNDALTLVDGTLIAAPRFFDGVSGAPSEALLSSYRASDGEPTGIVNITELGLDVRGLAATSSRIFALSEGVIHVFTRQGEHQGTVEVAELSAPRSMTLVDDELVVLDRDTLVFVPLAALEEAHLVAP